VVGKAMKIKCRPVINRDKNETFSRKRIFRLVGISVERKNKSVPSVCVFCPMSSSRHQKSQDSGLKNTVKIANGRIICIQKIQAKKSLVF
jgi:biotin synthase-like enzyme